jgi:hypothetical protein
MALEKMFCQIYLRVQYQSSDYQHCVCVPRLYVFVWNIVYVEVDRKGQYLIRNLKIFIVLWVLKNVSENLVGRKCTIYPTSHSEVRNLLSSS